MFIHVLEKHTGSIFIVKEWSKQVGRNKSKEHLKIRAVCFLEHQQISARLHGITFQKIQFLIIISNWICTKIFLWELKVQYSGILFHFQHSLTMQISINIHPLIKLFYLKKNLNLWELEWYWPYCCGIWLKLNKCPLSYSVKFEFKSTSGNNYLNLLCHLTSFTGIWKCILVDFLFSFIFLCLKSALF
jgi:hypothetical protein